MDLSRPAAGLRTRRLSRGLSRRPSGWLGSQLLRHTTLDGVRPAAIADFESWRFAIPTLGPELVTNGGFDADSGWTKGTGVTISGGTLNADSTLVTNVGLDSSGITPVVGGLYLVVYTVTAVTNASGGVSVTFGGAVPVARTTTGTFSEYITAANTETIKVYKRGASQWAGSIDNISVREVLLTQLRECSFDEWFAYTASSTTARTYVDSSGTLANNLSVDAPRRDFSTGASRLLLENAATNICLQSEDFSAVGWLRSETTVTLNAGTAPNGTNTANKLVENTANSQHYVIQTMTFSAGVTYTGSVYFKPAEHTLIRVILIGGGNYYGIIFDANDQSISETSGGTVANQSYKIEPVNDGWYRISVTCSQSATSVGLRINLNGANTYTGDGTSGFYIWGAQVEAASFPTTYIPTTTGSVTRAIESARFAPLVEALMQRSAATIVVRGVHFSAAEGGRRVIGMTGSYMLIRSSTGAPSLVLLGLDTAPSSAGAGFPGPFGISIGFNTSGYSGSVNGGNIGGASGISVDPRTEVYLARSATVAGGSRYGDGLYASVVIYPTRLSNAALQYVARA